jgi:HAD superfamily phosphatase (TIGR01668 family)
MLTHLVPDLYVKSIYEIDFDKLKKRGIKGIVTDLDNTLIEWNRPEATPELINWIKQVQSLGFSIVIVSNNSRIRVEKVAKPLGVPFVHRAKKPLKIAFKQALKKLNLPVSKTVVIGDQVFTDIFGANRMGLYTILVVPVAENDGWATRFNRFMERFVLNWMKKRGLIPLEDHK